MIFEEAIGNYDASVIGRSTANANHTWEFLDNTMLKEVSGYGGYSEKYADTRCLAFIEKHPNVDECLNLVEFVCQVLGDFEKNANRPEYRGAKQFPRAAIDEINARFLEASVGYQLENGKIVRVDNQYIHAEAVKPALALLSEEGFDKANEDFLEAHEHYRHGRSKECNVAGLRAFESTLKAICAQQDWVYQPDANASELIKVVRKNGLFSKDFGNGLDTYISMMKTGVPTVRNKAGGHGEAPGEPEVPPYLAAYTLHLTASNIVMLVDAYKSQ